MAELDERIARVETKIDFIIGSMKDLPPSPTCIKKHVEYEAKFDAIESWRNKMIGAFLILNVVLIIFIDKIKAFFS